MTAHQFANLFNITGIGVVFFVSLMVLRTHPAPIYRFWTKAYLFDLLLMATEAIAPELGRPLYITLLEAGLFATGAWYFWRAGLTFTERDLSRQSLGVLILVFAFYSSGMGLLGLPHIASLILPLLGHSAALVWLGIVMLRHLKSAVGIGHGWLGWPVILLGIWPLTYPVLEKTSFFWSGYWIAGLLQLLVGTGMVVFLLDDAAGQLKVKNERLLELDRLKTNFLNTVSHELRTPLTAIKGLAWLLNEDLKDALTQKQSKTLKAILSHCDSLTALINDTLSLSVMESGEMAYDKSVQDIRTIIEETTNSLSPMFLDKGLVLSVELPDEPLWANIDEEKMSIVLGNLLSNARKFTEAGGHVVVRARADAGTAFISVSDNGIGIATEHLSKIFDKFYQVDGSVTRERGGAGLGLAICKLIVESGHKGRIWAERNEERGTTLFVTLPLLADRPTSIANRLLVD